MIEQRKANIEDVFTEKITAHIQMLREALRAPFNVFLYATGGQDDTIQ